MLTGRGRTVLCWPWKGLSAIAEEIQIGQVVEGKVSRILPYGAMVELSDGVTGLVHISQIAEEYVREVGDHLRLGDVVRAKVVGVKEPGKYQLSIKALTAPAGGRGSSGPRGGSRDLEDKIAHFMKESQQRQAGLKKERAQRRGRRR